MKIRIGKMMYPKLYCEVPKTQSGRIIELTQREVRMLMIFNRVFTDVQKMLEEKYNEGS